MKKHFILLLSILTITTATYAQKEYKMAVSSGRLSLNIPGVIIEGYNGKEIIFSIPRGENEVVDERAAGLRVINGSGYTDNTGLGIDVSRKGEEITVNSVTMERGAILTIRVPQNINVSFKNSSSINQSEIILKNLNSEINVSTSYDKVKLENNTGPMNIKALYGSVDATFASEIKGPVSIVSVYGYVDVSLPSAAKANVKLSTSYGKLYAAEGLKIALDNNISEQTEDNINGVMSFSTNDSGTIIRGLGSRRGSGSINGKINGGGADFILKSSYKNVYLREQ